MYGFEFAEIFEVDIDSVVYRKRLFIILYYEYHHFSILDISPMIGFVTTVPLKKGVLLLEVSKVTFSASSTMSNGRYLSQFATIRNSA
jgi:hypothetical protein